MEETPFRFFDLARELRNFIYGELTCNLPSLEDGDIPQSHSCPAFDLIGHANSALRLVSRRFKAEYEDEVVQSARLCLHTFILRSSSLWTGDTESTLHQAVARSGLVNEIRTLTWCTSVQCRALDPRIRWVNGPASLHMQGKYIPTHGCIPLGSTIDLSIPDSCTDSRQILS